MVTVAEYLFAPCALYELDAEVADRDDHTCVTCWHQFQPGRVCPMFRKRLLRLAVGEDLRDALRTRPAGGRTYAQDA